MGSWRQAQRALDPRHRVCKRGHFGSKRGHFILALVNDEAAAVLADQKGHPAPLFASRALVGAHASALSDLSFKVGKTQGRSRSPQSPRSDAGLIL